jgi:hypothetical protein
VRQSAEYFGAEEAAFIVIEPGHERPEVAFALPADAS